MEMVMWRKYQNVKVKKNMHYGKIVLRTYDGIVQGAAWKYIFINS